MIGSIIFHIVFMVFMALLSRFLPDKRRVVIKNPLLKRLYARTTVITILILFVWTPFASWILGIGFSALADWNRSHFADTPWQIVATLPAWCCVAAFFVLAWTLDVLTFFTSVQNMDTVHAITRAQEGFDDRFVWRGFKRLFIILGIAAFVFTSDYGLFVYDKHVEYNPLLSLFQQQKIPFDGIESIEYERDLKKEKAIMPLDPVYVLKFRDGREWRSNFSDLQMVRPVMETLSHNSGLRIDTIFISGNQ